MPWPSLCLEHPSLRYSLFPQMARWSDFGLVVILDLGRGKEEDGGVSPLQDGEYRNLFLHIRLPGTVHYNQG